MRVRKYNLLIVLALGSLLFLACGSDPEPVTITSPEYGATVSGNVMIKVEITGSVDHVHFYINETLYYDDDSAPYQYEWETIHEVNGSYTIEAEAHFTSGNEISDEISVTVQN
jgi:hypothetical protein